MFDETVSNDIDAYSGDSTQLLYLRSRMFSPEMARFTSKDTWLGDYNRPHSLNRWSYVEGNPVNRIDPTGMCWYYDGKIRIDPLNHPASGPCNWFVDVLRQNYNVLLPPDVSPENWLNYVPAGKHIFLPVVNKPTPPGLSASTEEWWELLRYEKKFVWHSYGEVTKLDVDLLELTSLTPIEVNGGVALTTRWDCKGFSNECTSIEQVTYYAKGGIGAPGVHAGIVEEYSDGANTCFYAEGGLPYFKYGLNLDPNDNGPDEIGIYTTAGPTALEGGIQAEAYDMVFLLARSKDINKLGGYRGFGKQNLPGFDFVEVVDKTTKPYALLLLWDMYDVRMIR